ncbi:hypothetical protein HHI36_008774 [Cryptolaemus montrouzieri]|uniref:Uncharacterized protein n=1 Tax=Cryptolaemus montrouzieri TaxID=559131 RepID=A0ABD2MTI9_9CUCU
MPNDTPTNSNSQPRISLEMAERMLNKYDEDKNKLHEFIDNCQMALSLVSQANTQLLFTILRSKICDRARLFIKNRDITNWQSLKQYSLDGCTDRRTQGQWQFELHACKQMANETVMSIANKVENCYIELLST